MLVCIACSIYNRQPRSRSKMKILALVLIISCTILLPISGFECYACPFTTEDEDCSSFNNTIEIDSLNLNCFDIRETKGEELCKTYSKTGYKLRCIKIAGGTTTKTTCSHNCNVNGQNGSGDGSKNGQKGGSDGLNKVTMGIMVFLASVYLKFNRA